MKKYIELYSCQLKRIEELAIRLFQQKLNSPQDLWKIQTDLARCQISIFEEIKNQRTIKEKINNKIGDVVNRRENGWQKIIQGFQGELKESEIQVDIHQHAYKIAKQLGDSIAWLFFKGDERKIQSLSTNASNPVIPTGVSLQGMLTVAETLANAGAGFPIIHDLTNCLRVGDLTFVNVLDKDDEPLTVEVKTKIESVKDGIVSLKVSIYAIALSVKFVKAMNRLQNIPIELRENHTDVEQKDESLDKKANQPAEESNDQLVRQIRRMAFSKAFQTSKHDERIEIVGDTHLSIPVLPERFLLKQSHFHWGLIRELATLAKNTGYASCAVDDAFLYVAIYSETPILFPWSKSLDLSFKDRLTDDYKNKLPLCAGIDKNSIVEAR